MYMSRAHTHIVVVPAVDQAHDAPGARSLSNMLANSIILSISYYKYNTITTL